MKKTILISLTFSVIFLQSCNTGGAGDDRRYYLLDVQRNAPTLTTQNEAVLLLRSFQMSPGFSPKELTYRSSDSQYESDYYHQFLIDAGQQITEQARLWLLQSKYFAEVIHGGSDVDPTHILEGNIAKLYGDFRDENQPRAVMNLELFLIDIKTDPSQVILSQTYEHIVNIPETTAEGLIQAYNLCLQQILSTFETDLQKIKLELMSQTDNDN